MLVGESAVASSKKGAFVPITVLLIIAHWLRAAKYYSSYRNNTQGYTPPKTLRVVSQPILSITRGGTHSGNGGFRTISSRLIP